MLERHDGKVVDISRPVFLDIETTGLYEDDEIVEIAIADYDGREIMNEYIKPVYAESWPEAQGIHGISPQTVAHSSTFVDQVPAIRDAIRDRVVAVYNAEFELQFLPSHVVAAADLFVCVMELYREIRGLQKYVKNTYRLQNAMDWCRYRKSQTHRAMEDNLGTIAVWDKLREQGGGRFENAVSRHCYYVY